MHHLPVCSSGTSLYRDDMKLLTSGPKIMHEDKSILGTCLAITLITYLDDLHGRHLLVQARVHAQPADRGGQYVLNSRYVRQQNAPQAHIFLKARCASLPDLLALLNCTPIVWFLSWSLGLWPPFLHVCQFTGNGRIPLEVKTLKPRSKDWGSNPTRCTLLQRGLGKLRLFKKLPVRLQWPLPWP